MGSLTNALMKLMQSHYFGVSIVANHRSVQEFPKGGQRNEIVDLKQLPVQRSVLEREQESPPFRSHDLVLHDH